MNRLVFSALRLFTFLTLLTGVLYPLLVTGLAQVLFPYQANGSLVRVEDKVRGSSLLGQSNQQDHYFWSRPSAVGYSTLPSGGSNLSQTSEGLAVQVSERSTQLRQAHQLLADAVLPSDMLTASASGLDPHISLEAAYLQVERVANARNLEHEAVMLLVEAVAEPPQLGFLGMPRVNVLILNRALDEAQPNGN